MPTSGDRIRELRDDRKWTQERLAEGAGMSKGFLSDVENNKRNLSADYALKIANALGVSLDYLLRGESGQREADRAPVQIPPELSEAAQELDLTYAQTLTLLDAHNSVVARRSLKTTRPPTKEDWKRLRGAIKDLYPDASKSEE